jgi:hypothetical protein
MPEFIPPKDCNNKPVAVGDKVRVLSISNRLLDRLPNVEVKNLRSMIGEVFIVDEIDEYGGVWVEKVWDTGNGTSQSHSYSLDPEEMELVQKK